MESFKKYFTEAGIETVYEEVFESGTPDFSSQVQKIKANNVKFIVPVIEAFNDAVLLYRQIKEYECQVGFLCCGGAVGLIERRNIVETEHRIRCPGPFSAAQHQLSVFPGDEREIIGIAEEPPEVVGGRDTHFGVAESA
jgi:hypothetical protein